MWRGRIITIIMLFAFATPAIALAAGLVPVVPQTNQGSNCTGSGGCQSICDLALLAQNVLNDGIYIAVFLSAALFAWAGWKHMTAGGDMNAVKAANEVFMNVFIGLIVILSAWLIVSTLMSVLAGNGPTPTMPWNQICTA